MSVTDRRTSSWTTARLQSLPCIARSRSSPSGSPGDIDRRPSRDHTARCRVLSRTRIFGYGCSLRPCIAWCSRRVHPAMPPEEPLMDIVLRALAAYVFILFLMRVVGRRELSSMEPSDVILLVVIGDLVQNGVTQSDYSVTGIVLAAGTIGVLATITAVITHRWSRIRNVIEGEPVILVQDGQLIERNM